MLKKGHADWMLVWLEAALCGTLLFAGPGFAFADEVIRFVESSGYHGQQRLYIDGDYGGNIGDSVVLSNGEHRVSYSSEYRYRLSFVLVVESGNVSLRDPSASRFSGCIDGVVDTHEVLPWSGGEIVRRGNDETGIFLVEMAAPEYRSQGEPTIGCSEQPVRGTRAMNAITLNLSSVPPGAGVYDEDGERQTTTNRRWRFPYFERQRRLRIVLKLEGFANCLRDVDLVNTDDATEPTVHCEMTVNGR